MALLSVADPIRLASGDRVPTYVHDLDEFVLVQDGTREVRLGDEIEVVPPGALIFIPAGVAHSGPDRLLDRSVWRAMPCRRARGTGGKRDANGVVGFKQTEKVTGGGFSKDFDRSPRCLLASGHAEAFLWPYPGVR